ncbi:MAG: DnaJ domain-containing protein [Elusimicrobia bacterium]|nr:DnaJ domain-containing protein [Elusimicrobiota bacterium]
MEDFKQIDGARKLLRLDEEASMEEIKGAFRSLSLKYHPDRCKEKDKKRCEEMFKKISHAKDVIFSYCASYRYSFKEKDIKKNTVDKELCEHLEKFYDGWYGDLDL